MWLIDKLFNRKIEGESSLDSLEPLKEEVENLKSLSDKASVVGNKVVVDGDFEADGITSKGIANTGALANIGDVAISGDLDASGDLTAKTLKQSEANWSFELPEFTPAEGLTATKGYGKISVINNVLYCVINYSVENPTASEILQPDVGLSLTLPADVGSKIFDIENKKVSEERTGNALITEYLIYKSNVGGTATSAIGRLSNTNNANIVTLRILSATSIPANSVRYFTGRFFLDLM